MQPFEYKLLRLLGRAMPYLTVLFLLGFAWSGWNLMGTRIAAIPGTYVGHGAWGDATLQLQKTGAFTMVVHRSSAPGKPAATQRVSGSWKASDRDSFWRTVTFEPFVGLAEWNRGDAYEYYPATYGPYGLHGAGFQIEPKTGIFLRSSWRFW